MEVPLSQQGGEMVIPLNTAYGHDPPHPHNNNNNIIIPISSNGPLPPNPISTHLDHHSSVPYNGKKTTSTTVVKYKECLKNHAAAMGGNATDGCGEFMPSGEEGTLEALTCSACACHRNFHRKQTTPDDPGQAPALFHYPHHHPMGGAGAYFPPPLSRTTTPHHHHQMIMPYSIVAGGGKDDESDHEVGEDPITMRVSQQQQQKKRFRTKFTQEQKEKMLGFAERVGWKIQKQEEAVVHQFCQEVGVKRRVLKVWMHNNKHNLARRNTNTNTNNNPINTNTASCSSLQHQSTTSITHTHHLQGTG